MQEVRGSELSLVRGKIKDNMDVAVDMAATRGERDEGEGQDQARKPETPFRRVMLGSGIASFDAF